MTTPIFEAFKEKVLSQEILVRELLIKDLSELADALNVQIIKQGEIAESDYQEIKIEGYFPKEECEADFFDEQIRDIRGCMLAYIKGCIQKKLPIKYIHSGEVVEDYKMALIDKMGDLEESIKTVYYWIATFPGNFLVVPEKETKETALSESVVMKVWVRLE